MKDKKRRGKFCCGERWRLPPTRLPTRLSVVSSLAHANAISGVSEIGRRCGGNSGAVRDEQNGSERKRRRVGKGKAKMVRHRPTAVLVAAAV